ncbi:MAG: GMC family oxidoreductase [Polyangiaceae bacterium]
MAAREHYDWIIVGSGFGGSVSALRLSEKGYKVLVLEKGKRFSKDDFPTTNWDVKRWLWMPSLGMKGIFQMSFLQHVTILHGVGVGGGSLVYANTLPEPKEPFFKSPSWAGLADWQRELAPHYQTAKRMLGAARNPIRTRGDQVLLEIAKDMGREDHFQPTDVAVYFGAPGVVTKDPYFDGKGPDRAGCTHCGACMTGCRVGAKNTLDRNYLWLAERLGAEIVPETEVVAVRPRPQGGYRLEVRSSTGGTPAGADPIDPSRVPYFTADNVVLAGGVMGTVPLLLAMKEDRRGLPKLSARVGDFVRTNSEALFGVTSPDPSEDFSKGVAITSILHTDEHSHIEPVRYAKGSGFFRTLVLPQSGGPNALARLTGAARSFLAQPLRWARSLAVRDWAKQTQILLFMRTLEGTLSLRLGKSVYTGLREGLVSKLDDPSERPQSNIPEARDLARRFAEKVGGVAATLLTETLMDVPTTAHILGGATMGDSPETGVIDHRHRVFGYDGLYVIDGAAVSANPGVNPSLTITALAERAMSFIPNKTA